jgi:transcriptional regulator with XRE-family HTH domain
MLNEALRLIRAYHDLSQSELCAQLGISNSYLSEIESGKKQPTLDLLNRYSEQFGIPVSSLLFFSENLHQAGITSGLRVGAAKKVLALLQWVEAKSVNKREVSRSR